MPKTPTTEIEIAPVGQLGLEIQKELVKLPTQAIHNHFHNLGQQAQATRDQLLSVEIVAPILCALELEHQKEVAHVQPWKEWVKSNCEFSHATYTRYAKILKHARAGDIDALDPELVPDTPPSLMSADDLKDTCETLANALQGYRGIRQLYLELEVIKTPQKNTMLENRTDNKDKSTKEEETTDTAAEQLSIDEQDAIDGIIPALKPLDEYIKLGHHQRLPKSKLKDLDDSLVSAREILKPFLAAK